MKKAVFVFALVAVSFAGYSQSNDSDLEDQSIMCKIYRVFLGDDSAGCGGGKKVCCANTRLNHV